MQAKFIAASLVGLFLASGPAFAEPDWAKVPSRSVTVFYPGVSPIEWIRKGVSHSGARGMKAGEPCIACHEKEAADVGKRIVTGEKLEPKPIKGKAGSIPVTVQAANDGSNLYLRFSWKTPPGGGPAMDPENAMKIAYMLEDNKVELSSLGGCWSTCHGDARTMPEAKDDKKTKYVKDGNLATGVFYDLVQFKSGKGAKPVDGYVADKRVMEGGKALVSAEGKESGGVWTVTFVRKFVGGEGDVTLQSGKTYNFGFAIHDDHTIGRFHFVSFGYKLGIDTKGDITASKY